MNLFSILRVIKQLNINTLMFNFKYFPFWLAITFPVYVGRKVKFENLKGCIEIHSETKPGMILLGKSGIGIFDNNYSRMVLDIHGKIIFKGTAHIGQGSKISVGINGTLQFGNNFRITAQSTIIAYKEIVFGDNTLVSWNNLIMDTDFHSIKDLNGELLNPDKEIVIGNNVWIGCNCLILKGANVGDGSVVAANSFVNKNLESNNSIIGGNPLSIIKENIIWNA
jgi:acetyltransferase-like isoleucine patch superfamily enzyme